MKNTTHTHTFNSFFVNNSPKKLAKFSPKRPKILESRGEKMILSQTLTTRHSPLHPSHTDYEYEHRIYRVLAPPANTTTYPDVFALHGNKATGQSSYTSGTTKIAEKLLQTRMSRGRELNPEYLAKKWGCKRPRRKGDGWKEVDYKTCRFLVPFNMTGSEIWTWEVDLSRRARLYGVFGYFSGLWGGDRRPSRVVLGNPFTQSYKGVVPGVAGW